MVQSRFNHFTLISVWALALCAPTFMHGMDAGHPAAVAAPAAGNCAICTQIMTANQHPRTLVCGHTFHAACINEWFAGHHTTCPTCRQEVVDADGRDLVAVADYAPVAPAPIVAGAGIMARLAHVGARARYIWQTITPQPVRDVLGFALDVSALAAADRGPELVAQAIIRRQNAAKSVSDEVQKIEAQTQTEASTPTVTPSDTNVTATAFPATSSTTPIRRPNVMAEVMDEYNRTREYTWWLWVPDVFGVSRPASRATLALYLNREVFSERPRAARFAALNTCLATDFAVSPLASDAHARAFRLLNPLFNATPDSFTEMLQSWSAEYAVVVAKKLAILLSKKYV